VCGARGCEDTRISDLSAKRATAGSAMVVSDGCVASCVDAGSGAPDASGRRDARADNTACLRARCAYKLNDGGGSCSVKNGRGSDSSVGDSCIEGRGGQGVDASGGT